MSYKKLIRRIIKLSILGGILFLMRAKHFNTHDNIAFQEVITSDTALKVCNNDLNFIQASDTMIDLADFAAFAAEYCEGPLTIETERLLDTTGDGNMEIVRTSVLFNDTGQCIVRNSIMRDKKVLWNDEMIIDEKYGAWLFGGKENYDKLYPLSAFYLGAINAPFTDVLDREHRDYDLRKKTILNKLANTDVADELKKIHNSSIAEYMDEYKGMYVFSLHMAARDIYIWDPIKKTFVPIYLS